MGKNSSIGKVFLVLSALIWGCGLVAQKNGMDYLGPFAFTAIRCSLGGVSLLPLVWIMERKKSTSVKSSNPKPSRAVTFKASVICGLALAAIILFQQTGISYTTVGKAGFITGLYIIITPILERVLGKQISKNVWISAAIGLIGLAMLTLSGGIEGLTAGDVLMLGGAFSAAVHIIVIDKWVRYVDSVKLSCYQFLVAGVLYIPLAVIFETTTWEAVVSCAVPILYTGLLSCGMGYTLQTLGQRSTPPSQASLILSLETVFTLLAGMLFLNEMMTGMEYAGCAVMFAAILLSQKKDRKL